MTDLDADGFSILPGWCFRLIIAPGEDTPRQCPRSPCARGDWVSRGGRVYHDVEACALHEPELVGRIDLF